ncbi:MAG: NAD(+) synthase [Oscillospiraceae bacterium]|nr:NAD(+) synthase [Oscillospiraceae bacterium]
MEQEYIRLAVGIPRVTLADCEQNRATITTLIDEAISKQVDILVLPELSLTGATCGDLFFQSTLLTAAERALASLIAHTAGSSILVAVGLPALADTEHLNCAALIQGGKLLGIVPKATFPNRFSPATPYTKPEITLAGVTVPFGKHLLFPCPKYPTHTVAIETDQTQTATIYLNLTATPEQIGQATARRNTLAAQSADRSAAIAYAGAGHGESTTDAVYSGHGLIAANGQIHTETQRFTPHTQLIHHDINLNALSVRDGVLDIPFSNSPATPHPTMPFFPPGPLDDHCQEIFTLQTVALKHRLESSGCKTAILGVSGGLDSTLALLVAKNAGDVLGVSMPGFGTTARTRELARQLMDALNVPHREIDIQAACLQHFADIGHDPSVQNIVYENTQARERTQILMDLANQTGGLVVGTGNLSEIALGWSTYGGDHMSMYAVNAGLPKTILRAVVTWLADAQYYGPTVSVLLQNILNTPISPELLPPDQSGSITQKTESLIGPYALHDFFLYYVIRHGYPPANILTLAESAFADTYNRSTILRWLNLFYRRFFTQQFKRSCMPDGPQIGPISLSPRTAWHMPSDALYTEWQRELDRLL